MEKSVVYYSRNGSTEVAADYIAEKINGKKIRLYTGRFLNNFFLGALYSIKGKIPKLKKNPWKEVGESNVIVLAFPIWAGGINPAIRSFIYSGDLKGRSFYLLSLQADPEKDALEKTLPLAAKLIEARGGVVKGIKAIHGANPGRRATKEYIAKQLADWELPE